MSRVRSYQVSSGAEHWHFDPPGARLRGLAVAEDGRIAVANSNTVYLLPHDRPEPLFAMPGTRVESMPSRRVGWRAAALRIAGRCDPNLGHANRPADGVLRLGNGAVRAVASPPTASRAPRAARRGRSLCGTSTSEVAMLVWEAHRSRIRSLAFSPDVRLIATTAGKSKYVWLWNTSTGRIVRKLSKGENSTRLAAFHPDGRHIVGLFDAAAVCLGNSDRPGGCGTRDRALAVLRHDGRLADRWPRPRPRDSRARGMGRCDEAHRTTAPPAGNAAASPAHSVLPAPVGYSPSGRYLCFLERN